jgi:hypothetical protein
LAPAAVAEVVAVSALASPVAAVAEVVAEVVVVEVVVVVALDLQSASKPNHRKPMRRLSRRPLLPSPQDDGAR